MIDESIATLTAAYVTSNSIHYVLDSDGRVIDALPGLYSPREFMNGLTLARTCSVR